MCESELSADYERMLALLSAAVRGALLSTVPSETGVQAFDLTVKSFSAEVTAESLVNQLVGIARELGPLKFNADLLGQLSETESARLQMAMDRVSKLMGTLGNLLKKISDTASAITQNLK
jgi:hypothetical protein